ncbi:hypothetical protein [Actinomadura macrotermitis]|nr:hypothetical protein [Actinomadura macrotermitis]
MNPMYLIYVPVAVLFAAFVVYGGLIMPLTEMTESLRRHEESRGGR